jgi:hypothetical protein
VAAQFEQTTIFAIKAESRAQGACMAAEATGQIGGTVGIFGSATASVRSNMAVHHLHSAAKAAERAFRIEEANPGADHGPWFDEIMHTAPVAIIMAAAAMEAHANESIQDLLDRDGLSPAQKELLRREKERTAGSALDRWETAALLVGVSPDRGRHEWGDAKLLTRMRNGLMHFRPAWSHHDETDANLVNAVAGRGVRLYPPYATGNLRFPYCFFTYSAAKWSVETARLFVAHIAPALGVVDRFAKRSYALP